MPDSLPTVTTIRTPTFAHVIALLTHRSNKHHNYLLPFVFLQRLLKVGQPFHLKLQLPRCRHVFLRNVSSSASFPSYSLDTSVINTSQKSYRPLCDPSPGVRRRPSSITVNHVQHLWGASLS